MALEKGRCGVLFLYLQFDLFEWAVEARKSAAANTEELDRRAVLA